MKPNQLEEVKNELLFLLLTNYCETNKELTSNETNDYYLKFYETNDSNKENLLMTDTISNENEIKSLKKKT
jgi:hypothetical protein